MVRAPRIELGFTAYQAVVITTILCEDEMVPSKRHTPFCFFWFSGLKGKPRVTWIPYSFQSYLSMVLDGAIYFLSQGNI